MAKKDDFLAEEAKAADKAKKKADKADKKANKDKKPRKNPFKAIGAFFKSVRSEGKKVVWPKAKEVFKNTLVVLVVILVLGVMIYLVDLGLTQGMKGIKNLADNTTTSAEASDDTAALEDETVEDTTEATTEAAE
jgi:preprotein translocase subunit SecE